MSETVLSARVLRMRPHTSAQKDFNVRMRPHFSAQKGFNAVCVCVCVCVCQLLSRVRLLQPHGL